MSESMVIKTNDLAIALQKVSSGNILGLSMEEGSSKFKLPGNLGDMGGGDVNVKVRSVLNWAKDLASSKKNTETHILT